MPSLFVTRRKFLATAGAISCLPAFGKKPGISPPNVLLIIADQIPASALGCYGNKDSKTPNIDLLARRGVRFQNALACSRGSASGRATLLSGRTPLQHGVSGPGTSLGASEVLLTDLLSGEGYDVGFAGAWGLGKDSEPGHGIRWSHIESGSGGTATSVTDQSLLFLDQQKSQTKPFLLVVSHSGGSSLASIDNQLPRLLEKLHLQSAENNTLVVFTSSGGTPEALRTPMVYFWPSRTPTESHPPELIGSYDFLPTLCDATAATVPDRNLCGRSYYPLIEGKTFPKKAPWKPMIYGSFRDAETATDNRFELIMRPEGKGPSQLFDLTADPKQAFNQYANRNFIATRDQLRHSLADWKTKFSK